MACTARKACPQHVHTRLRASAEEAEQRENSRLESWISLERDGLRPLYRDPDVEAASLAAVDERIRRATLASLPRVASSEGRMGRTIEEFRDMYGPERPESALVLDSNWEQAREPRTRVKMLLAAGWSHVTHTGGGHDKWIRKLPFGAGEQQITFQTTPRSPHFWDKHKADLTGYDAEYRELLEND